MKICAFLFVVFSISLSSQAQSALSGITGILQAKCTSGCHSGASPSGNLDLSGSDADIYDALYRVNPDNLAARGEGMKLVHPGYPLKSYLLKKINNGLEPNFDLNANQGTTCPKNLTPLDNAEIELVRQWILAGAPDTGKVLNQHLIQDYYSSGGLSRIDAPTPPSFGQGMQIHYGPFFLSPGQEIEIFKKHDLALPDDVEVYRMDVRMNWQSHHFILWKFDDSNLIDFFPEGTRDIYTFPNVLNAKTVFGWQYTDDITLPAGAAYFWNRNTVLDLDYHLKNYSSDSILAAEVFINVYYYPKGFAQHEMIAEGEIFDINGFCVPADGQQHFYTDAIYISDSSRMDEEWDIWMLSSHTHKYGLDFDIFRRNADGTKGEQVYEGFYSTDYSFNQGYYDFAHPAIRKITPTLRVKASEGLIYEALFKNYGSQTACFGPTTDDEMLVAYYQYTVAGKATSASAPKAQNNFTVFPNPFNSSALLAFELGKGSTVELEIFNSLGMKVNVIASGNLSAGKHSYPISALQAGAYFARLAVNGRTEYRTIVSF